MGLLKLILFCTLLSLCSADPNYIITNSMLDPSRLFWWRTKWASAPVILSVNNVSQISTATFFFSPTTSITGGVFEVTFPTGFTVGAGGTGQSFVGQVVQYAPVTFQGGQDYQVTITGLTNPPATGAYGPFALRTRYSAASQQVDVNLAFGSVWIYSAAGILGSFTVSLAGTTINNVIYKSGNTLSYKFTLGVSLWRYDTFILSIDSKWTVASGATCASADYAGKWNNFNGTNSASPHQIDCVVTASAIYIYGLAVDGIDLMATMDNAYVDLRVGLVTTPNAVYSGIPYSWTASTSRFGTSTILETATYTAGPSVTTDVISLAAWTPTWGLSNSAIATGTSYFMDLSFSITNPIPVGGKITITVTENISVIDPNWYSAAASNCYIVTYLNSYAPYCTIASNTITLSSLPALSAGTSIKVRNIVSFTAGSGGTEQVTSLLTFDANGYSIDANVHNLATFTLATNTAVVTNFAAYLVDKTTLATTTSNLAGGTSLNQAVVFAIGITPTPLFSPSTAVTIYCPFTSDIEDFSINVPTSAYSFAVSTLAQTGTGSSAIPGAITTTPIANNVPRLTTTESYSTLGNIAFTGGVNQASSVATPYFTTVLNLLLFVASGTTYITLPRVSNSLATAYECRIMITTPSTSSTVSSYSAGVRFLVSPQVWNSKTFLSPCTNYIDGIPAIFSLQPTTLGAPPATNSGATYYVEFGFSGVTSNTNFGAGSGISTIAVTTQNYQSSLNNAFTTAYPVQSSQSGSISAVTYVANAVNYVAVTGLTIPGFVTGATAAPVKVTFPIGGYAVSASVSSTISTYYILTADPRYKFITHRQLSTSFVYAPTTLIGITPFASGTAGSVYPVIGESNTNTNGQPASTGLGLGLYSVSTGTYSSPYYLFFIFSKGWTWSNARSIISSSATAFTNMYYFSLNSSFGYPGALLYVSTSISLLNGFASGAAPTPSTATITLSGFALPLGVPASGPNVIIGLGGGASNTCTFYSSIAYTSTAGTINFLSVSPTFIKTSGPDGVNISHMVSFTLTHGVPAGGSINLTFSNSWSTPALSQSCTYCTVTGVSSLTIGGVTTTPVCTLSSNSAVVTGFADFSSTSSTAITIGIYGLIAPSSVSTSPGTQFVTALTTYVNSSGTPAVIDQATTFIGTLVTITMSTTSGTTTWTTKKTYPLNAGATGADLYLKFSLPHALPKCGLITISTPLPFLYSSGTVNNFSFLSPIQYKSSVISSSTLQITLGQAYTAASVLELYLDSAVNNPSSTSTTVNGFAITSSWGGVTVDTDTGPATSSQTFTASSLLTSSIAAANPVGITFVPTTTGEVATYTFDFKDTVNYVVGDQYWIVFPSQFDYFLGNTWIWFTNEPNSYYIDCSSSQLGTTWCTVNHGIVVVRGSNASTGNTEIVISINNIINPASAQTSAFQIYHVNSSGTYLTVNQNFGTVILTAYPTNLYVRSFIQSDNRLFQSATYTWRLYLTETMNFDSQLQVLFPQEYDLNKFDKKVSYSCSSTWLDNSTSGTIKTQQNWNSASACTASGNVVILQPPTTIITFTLTSIVTWNIESVTNTQWGQPRYAQSTTTDFDMQDAALWPITNVNWVGKFTFFVYRTAATNLLYTSRSYSNTNGAYIGFLDGYRKLYVNNYSPQSKTNRIVVHAGTQTTDIYISTASASQPCSAKQIILTPTTNSRTPDNGKLKYTSVTNNWILFQDYWRIQFRVAAAIDMIKGLYYIDWSNNEIKQTGLTDVQYETPASTLVEVIAAIASSYTFIVASIPNISTGNTSVPIKISITNAPHADATVKISVSGSPASIFINPTSLTFGPDINALYFQVSVANNYDLTLGTVQSLAFSITGTSASVYNITSTLKFTISQSSTTLFAGNVVSWGLGTATKTTETVTPSTDQVGVIYYQLSAAGTIVPSFSTLKASLGSLISSNSTSSSTGTTSSTPTSNYQSDPRTGETWTQFQYRLYKLHLQTIWIGSIAMITTTATTNVTFTWLYAATQYQLSGYLDNLNPSTNPLVHTELFTTDDIASPQPFIVVFQGNVDSLYGTKIAQEAANVQGVNPLRLGNATYTQSISRRLVSTSISSTTFAYTLVPNRFSESPDPSTQAQITGTALTTFTANLITAGISSALNSVTNSLVLVRTVPTWTAVPTSGGSTTNSITISLLFNTTGMACCVALTSSNTQPTPEQVMLGLDQKNGVASNACITTDLTKTTNTVQITNLTAGTNYYAFCTAMDNYPLWPTQMSYNTTNPMSYVAIATLASDTTATVGASANYIGRLLLLLALLLY